MHILVTGAAGFIGFHMARRLLQDGHHVVGFDNMNSYYDVALKEARLGELQNAPGAERFVFVRGDLAERVALKEVFTRYPLSHVVHMGAQAGVRYSMENPGAYVQSNLVGFANILECCRAASIAHLLYASSSSVYGLNKSIPFSEHDNVDHPVSLYAATKKSNELMAHSYSHLYGLPCTGLRFFTVYGPWGRPDMALFIFTKAIIEGRPVRMFNKGQLKRDFTYIDDIIEAMARLVVKAPEGNPAWDGSHPDPASSPAPWRIYNIGNNTPVELGHFVSMIEDAVGKKAVRDMLPMQPGDVEATWAEVAALEADVSFAPATPLADGIRAFVSWYRAYYSC